MSCGYCNMDLYARVQQYAMPVLAPLTEVAALEDELINLTGLRYMPLAASFCPMCGTSLTQLQPEDDYSGLKVKYRVYKARNNELVENCFVLRPDKDPAAVEALRAYASATENGQLAKDIIAWVGQPQPLTLDELGEAWQKGVPVYAKSVDGEPITRKPGVWCVLDGREVAGIGFQLIAVFGHNLTLAQSDYGKTWLAYAQRPEEGENGILE